MIKLIIAQKLNHFYTQFISLKGEPKSLARGVAIGTFIGLTPSLPFRTVLILVMRPLREKNIPWIIAF